VKLPKDKAVNRIANEEPFKQFLRGEQKTITNNVFVLCALIDGLPKVQTSRLVYFSQAIRTTMHMKCPNPTNRRRNLIHMDNSSLYRSKAASGHLKKFNFRPVRRASFSPDLSPSDFGVFGTIKGKPGLNSEVPRSE
jgi:hypothetical protein